MSETTRVDVYAEIERERLYQDERWGGPNHDDEHTQLDWCQFVQEYLDYAEHANVQDFRRNMGKIAALAVAAMEWSDRRMEKRRSTKCGTWVGNIATTRRPPRGPIRRTTLDPRSGFRPRREAHD